MTAVERTRIRVDPDGVPVALEDVAGDVLDGVLVGAARAGGAIALVVMEEGSGQAPTATVGHMRALADALLDDPNDPHLVEGTSGWWKEQLAARRAEADRLREAHDAQAATIREQRAHLEELRAGVTELAPAPEGGHQTWIATESIRGERPTRRWSWRHGPVYAAVTAVGLGLTVAGVHTGLAGLTALGGIATGIGWACLLIPEAHPDRGAHR